MTQGRFLSVPEQDSAINDLAKRGIELKQGTAFITQDVAIRLIRIGKAISRDQTVLEAQGVNLFGDPLQAAGVSVLMENKHPAAVPSAPFRIVRFILEEGLELNRLAHESRYRDHVDRMRSKGRGSTTIGSIGMKASGVIRQKIGYCTRTARARRQLEKRFHSVEWEMIAASSAARSPSAPNDTPMPDEWQALEGVKSNVHIDEIRTE